MAETVSFKVSLRNSGEKTDPEMRRFVVDFGINKTFSCLLAKLCSVYPRLNNQVLNVTWKDGEDDLVTISTDEELMIALTEMSGPVYKLNLQVTGIKETAGRDVHLGVVCDGCNQAVVGFRYKCQVCPDFDLCGGCEASGLHPEHNMTRIARPKQNLFPIIGQQFHGMPRNSCHRLCRTPMGAMPGVFGFIEGLGRTAGDHEESGQCPKGPYSNGYLFGKRCRSGKKSCKESKTGEKNAKNTTAKEEEKEATTSEEVKHENNENNENSKENYINKSNTEKIIHNFLEAAIGPIQGVQSEDIENVGKFISNIASLFNVEIDTEEKSNEPEDKTKEQELPTDTEVKDVDPEKEKPATSKTSEEEWTIVKDDSKDMSSSNLYPSLDEPQVPALNPTASPFLPAAPAPVADPKMQVALQAMINMGFTNEGGWLENLLRTKGGDIGKVLDVLKPNNN